MLVTLWGIDIEVRPLQLLNAYLPMLVTLSGIVIVVKLAQSSNASCPMAVTVDGITVLLQPAISVFDDVSMIALQLSRESYVVFPSSTIIEIRA